MSRAIARALSKEGIRVVLVDTRYQRVAKAREAGLNVCFASILSEYVMNAVDFEGLGRFLAMTSNDQINTLAAARFRELFGAQNVLQLPRGEASQRLETTWQNRLAGRCLFGPKLTYEFIDSALDQGATIKTTRFSQVFTMEAFRAHYGDRVYPLFLVDGARVHVIAADSKFNPRAGQVVISLVVPETTTVTSGPSDSTVLSDSSVVTSDAIVSAPPGSAS